MKDYYQILDLEVSATQEEIKKAYRQLALQYHPDKNPNDAGANARFSEIKEAYEVLTNPVKKEYYLEQRWFNHSQGRKKKKHITSAPDLLQEVLRFDRHVSLLDIHRLNKDGLYTYIETELLPDNLLAKLNTFKEKDINEQIVSLMLRNMFILPANRLEFFRERLLRIESGDKTKATIEEAVRKYQRRHKRDKYRIWVLLLTVLLISLLIFFLSN